MNTKKLYVILFLVVLVLSPFIILKTKTFYSTYIETVVDQIIINTFEQEKIKDATCWATTRQMQSHHINIKIHPLAVTYQIESTKKLITLFWASLSTNKFSMLSKKHIEKTIPTELLLKMKMLSSTDLSSKEHLQLSQHFEVTEHYRYLLSILYSYSIEPDSISLDMPTLEAIDSLAKLASILSATLLNEAKINALNEKSKYILPKHILNSQQKLIADYNLESAIKKKIKFITFKKMDLNTIKEKSEKIVYNKIEALKVYNKVDSSLDTALQKLNLLVSIPFDSDALKQLKYEIKKIPNTVLRGYKPLPFVFIINKPISEDTKMHDRRLLSLVDVSDSLDILLPITFLDNADVELLKGNQDMKKEEIEKVLLHNYDMDAVRDTGLHWEIISNILKNNQTLPIDPFAQELLAEAISIYTTFYIKNIQKKAKKNNEKKVTQKLFNIYSSKTQYWVPAERGLDKLTSQIDIVNKKKVMNEYKKPFFKEITEQSKISSFNFMSLSKQNRDFIFYTGNGVGAGDVNNDNYIDLFFPGEGGSKLYINNKDLTFSDKTIDYFSKELSYFDARQGVFADINNDFLLDLLVLHSDTPSQLWIQDKSNKFINITQSSGIKTQNLSRTAVFFDFNNDGLLDIFIGHYGPKNIKLKSKADVKRYYRKTLEESNLKFKSDEEFNTLFEQSYPVLKQMFEGKRINKEVNLDATNGVENQFYINLGNNTFKEIASQVGLDSTRYTLAAAAVDYNNDGYMDLHVINDFGYDQVYINQQGKGFIEKAKELNLADRGNGMNISIVDLNNDNYFDSYITLIDMFAKRLRFKFPTKKSTFSLDQSIVNTSFYLTGNKLFLNNKFNFNVNFNTFKFEPAELGWGWGATFFDYENDADLDLYIANGYKRNSIADKEQNHFLISDNSNYYLVEKDPILLRKNSRAVLSLDLENNGYLDLVISNYDDPPQIFKNKSSEKNNWIKIKLYSKQVNSFAIGATVSIQTKKGKFNKLVSAGSQYMSQEDPTLTFGLSDLKEVESISVFWPGAAPTTYKGPFKVNQLIEITHNEGIKRIQL